MTMTAQEKLVTGLAQWSKRTEQEIVEKALNNQFGTASMENCMKCEIRHVISSGENLLIHDGEVIARWRFKATGYTMTIEAWIKGES